MNLKDVEAYLDREQRDNINNNWRKIERSVDILQGQIYDNEEKAGKVMSVNGKVGDVTLYPIDIGSPTLDEFKVTEKTANDALSKANQADSKAIEAITTANNIIANAGDSNTEIVNGRQRIDGKMMPTIGDNIRLNEKNITDVQNQLKDSERFTTTLENGLSVVDAKLSTPVDVEISGRTLVNLIYDVSPFSITLDATKYYLIISETNAQVDVNGNLQNTPYKFTGRTDVQITWSPGNIALYEVAKTEYDKILVDWNSVTVNNLYPYVKDLQHLTNPYIESVYDNLVPPFEKWTLYSSAKIKSPYELEVTGLPNVHNFSYVYIPVVTGQTYNFHAVVPTSDSYFAVKKGKNTNPSYQDGINQTSTFTVDSSFNGFITMSFNRYGTGTALLNNPILSIGSKKMPFESRNIHGLFFEVKLGQIGLDKDVLYKQDGQWTILKKINTDVNPPSLIPKPQLINVNDKVKGDIVLSGLTQIEVGCKAEKGLTTNVTDLKLTYYNNIATTLDSVVIKQSNIATELSVHERAIVDLYVRVKALEASI